MSWSLVEPVVREEKTHMLERNHLGWERGWALSVTLESEAVWPLPG